MTGSLPKRPWEEDPILVQPQYFCSVSFTFPSVLNLPCFPLFLPSFLKMFIGVYLSQSHYTCWRARAPMLLPLLLWTLGLGICPEPHFSHSKPPPQLPVFTTLRPPMFAFPMDPKLFFWKGGSTMEGDYFTSEETQTFHYSELGKLGTREKLIRTKLLLTSSL